MVSSCSSTSTGILGEWEWELRIGFPTTVLVRVVARIGTPEWGGEVQKLRASWDGVRTVVDRQASAVRAVQRSWRVETRSSR